jgi:tetratricopeptide (TPR) repeat protein
MRTFSLVVLSLSFVSLHAQTGSTSGLAELKRASDLLNHGHPAQAVAILQKLAAVEPPIAGAEHELGTAYYSIGDLMKAKEAFARAIEQDKSDQDSVQMEGLTLYRLDRPDAAIPYLERVVRANPNVNADAQTILGLCFIRLNNYDDARNTYATLFGQPPDSAASFLLLATILR